MTWFETLTGFCETSPTEVRESIIVDGELMTSQANGKVMNWGRLETPSLRELRQRVRSDSGDDGSILVREIVADVQDLHTNVTNAGALFQVASQFNLLEMASPSMTPEHGVSIYEHDHTQGPACAIAAGAGTIYRNYFAPVHGQIGQSRSNQIDCLSDLGEKLGNADGHLWQMRNGYALPSRNGLMEISRRLRSLDGDDRDELRSLLRIGIQWDTQVTLEGCTHLISQAYCSALPVAYSSHSSGLWQDFARLVLEASYEATICAAVLNSRRTGNGDVFLTLLGGGAFGNETEWITDGMKRALKFYAHSGIKVTIVSYGSSRGYVRRVVEAFS